MNMLFSPGVPCGVAQDTCYYDGQCGMCRRSTRILGAIDWLGRLDFKDMTRTPEDELPVPLDQAMHRMPMRTGSGRVLIGFFAVRRAMVQTPLGFLPALALYLPGVSTIGDRVYDRVAANRAREGACVVAPDSGIDPRPQPPDTRSL